MFHYAMLLWLFALIACFIGFAGLAGDTGDLIKLRFVLCMAASVGCMLSETTAFERSPPDAICR